MAAPTYKADVRAADIARQLRMKPTRSVASGRYLAERTGTNQINAIVFHRNKVDCVGLEGTGKRRQWVSARHRQWERMGFK